MLLSDDSGAKITEDIIAIGIGESRLTNEHLYYFTSRVFVWRVSTEMFLVDCLVPTIKCGGTFLIVCGAISCRGLELLLVLRELD